MSREICDYVAATLVSVINPENPFAHTRNEFTGDFAQLKEYTNLRCDLIFPDQIIRDAIRVLAECGLVRITEDPYAGTFYKIKAKNFDRFTDLALTEIDQAREAGYDDDSLVERRSDYPNGAAYVRHRVISDYHELGDDWLKRALEGMRQKVSANWDVPSYTEADLIPASDRLVTLGDNAREQISAPLQRIVEELRSNSITNDLGEDAERIKSEISSGTELVKSTTVRLTALLTVLLKPLRYLAEKFSGAAIGELAKELIIQLLKLL